MLGSGINREVTGQYKKVIKMMNSDKFAPILSLDIPFAMNADAGNGLGIAVKVSARIIFICLKKEPFTGVGTDHRSAIYFNSLKVPYSIHRNIKSITPLIELKHDDAGLIAKKRTGHKSSYAHLLIIGGDHIMYSAALIDAEAGTHIGAGLISIPALNTHGYSLNFTKPELIHHDVECNNAISNLSSIVNVLIIEPSLGEKQMGGDNYYIKL